MKARFVSCLVAAAILTGCAVQPGVGIGVGAGTGGIGLGIGAGITLGSAKPAEKKEEAPVIIDDSEKAEFLELASMAIIERLDDPDEFTGKQCNLVVDFDKAAKLESVKSEGGDPALCEATIAAAKTAKFPAFFNDEEARELRHSKISIQI